MNLLRQRLGQVAAGIAPLPRAHRIMYENLRDALLADYAANKRKWFTRHGQLYELVHLDAAFGNFRAVDITTDSIRAFIRCRQEKGAANGTINRSLALLRRMFRLAMADGKLREVPHFPMLKEAPPRKGFLEHADYQKRARNCLSISGPCWQSGTTAECGLAKFLSCGGLTWTW